VDSQAQTSIVDAASSEETPSAAIARKRMRFEIPAARHS